MKCILFLTFISLSFGMEKEESLIDIERDIGNMECDFEENDEKNQQKLKEIMSRFFDQNTTPNIDKEIEIIKDYKEKILKDRDNKNQSQIIRNCDVIIKRLSETKVSAIKIQKVWKNMRRQYDKDGNIVLTDHLKAEISGWDNEEYNAGNQNDDEFLKNQKNSNESNKINYIHEVLMDYNQETLWPKEKAEQIKYIKKILINTNSLGQCKDVEEFDKKFEIVTGNKGGFTQSIYHIKTKKDLEVELDDKKKVKIPSGRNIYIWKEIQTFGGQNKEFQHLRQIKRNRFMRQFPLKCKMQCTWPEKFLINFKDSKQFTLLHAANQDTLYGWLEKIQDWEFEKKAKMSIALGAAWFDFHKQISIDYWKRLRKFSELPFNRKDAETLKQNFLEKDLDAFDQIKSTDTKEEKGIKYKQNQEVLKNIINKFSYDHIRSYKHNDFHHKNILLEEKNDEFKFYLIDLGDAFDKEIGILDFNDLIRSDICYLFLSIDANNLDDMFINCFFEGLEKESKNTTKDLIQSIYDAEFEKLQEIIKKDENWLKNTEHKKYELTLLSVDEYIKNQNQ